MGQQDTVLGQMQAAAQANRQDKAAAQERLKETSRRRLEGIIKTKIRTTMIGALDAMEKSIGVELWGHGKPDRECTPEQLAWRQVWTEKVRPTILNNGNNQLRAMQAEVLLYEVLWTGYQNTLPVAGRGE